MATKTFKIGECCKGGIITTIATKSKITIIGKEWDNAAGYSRGSNQSNAKEWTRLESNVTDNNVYRTILNFLEDLTTSYYANQIMEWIESKVELKYNSYTNW